MIKKIVFFLTLIISINASASGPVSISGTVTNKSADSIYLVSTLNLRYLQSTVIARAAIDAAGKYTLSYAANEPVEAALFVDKAGTQVFLEPDFNLVINFNASKIDSTVSYTGKGSDENSFLHVFNGKFENAGALNDNQVRIIKLDPKSFNKYNDSLRLAKQNFFKKNYKGNSKEFTNYINFKIDYFWANTKIIYPRIVSQVTGVKYDSIHLDTGYYRFLSPSFIENENALESNMYMTFLSNYHADYTLKDAAKNGWNLNTFYEKEYQLAKSVYHGRVREVVMANIVYQKFQQEKSEVALSLYTDCRKSIQDTTLLNPVLEYVFLMHRYDMGKPFPSSLVLKDSSGHVVNLSDFKGKLVFIDFWASWCGPCRGEMPHSRDLIEHFKGKDVVFLFVSIDQDANKWKAAMRQENLNGVHATSPGNWSSEATKVLNIPSIPRYMLLDRNGNFIDNNAPRPSGGAQQLIEEYLNK